MPNEIVLTENQLRRLCFLIKQDLSSEGAVKLGHVREALAYAAGIAIGPTRKTLTGPFDHAKFCQRISDFGYIGYAGFNLDEHVQKVLEP